MKFSADDYLNVVKPHCASALFSPRSMADMSTVARQIPGMATTFFGFECRLADEAATADLLLCTSLAGSERDILAGQDTHWHLPERFFSLSAWNRIRTFCRSWADPASPLHRKVHNTWLEFDLDDPPGETPVPSFFFGIRENLLSSAADQHRWVTEYALDPLFDPPLPDAVRRKLLACVDALPDQAYVFQIGAMLARSTGALRVCIRNITPNQITAYLTRIEWPGPVPELAQLISELAERVDSIDLDLDVGDTVFPTVGLECYLEQRPRSDSRWRAFLDHLVQRKLCRPDKRDALLQYPGHNHERAHPDRWPSHLLDLSEQMGAHRLSVVSRTIHHVKIAHRPGQPLEAKAYLSVQHHWVDTKWLELSRVANFLLGDSSPQRKSQVPEADRIRDFFLGQSAPKHKTGAPHSYNRLLAQAITAYRSGRSRMFPTFLSDTHILFRDSFQARIETQLSREEHGVYVDVRDATRWGIQLAQHGSLEAAEQCLTQAATDLAARAPSEQTLLFGESYLEQAQAFVATRLRAWERARAHLHAAMKTNRTLEVGYDFELCHILRVHLVFLLMRVEAAAGAHELAMDLAEQVTRYVLGALERLPVDEGWSRGRSARIPTVFQHALLARPAGEVGNLLAHHSRADAQALFSKFPSWRAFSDHAFLQEIHEWGCAKEAQLADDNEEFLQRCGTFLQAGRRKTTLWYAAVLDLCVCCKTLRPSRTQAFRAEVADDARRWQRLSTEEFPFVLRKLLVEQGKDHKSGTPTPGVTAARRFRAYNVGLPRTGTNSVASLFGHYLSAAEFMKWETVEHIIERHDKKISTQALQDFLLQRDRAGKLEMDSASFNHFYLDVLIETFPDAKFTFTVRDCYSWTNSFLKLLLHWRQQFHTQGVQPPAWMAEYGRILFGTFSWEGFSSPQALQARAPELVERFVKCWGTYNRRVLAILPPERSLIIRTDQISDRLDELAQFIGVPSASLTSHHHVNASPEQLDLLSHVDRSHFDALCVRHGGSALTQLFSSA